jgi:hypothetical protein
MDASSIAAILMAGRAAQTQTMIAARLMKMDTAADGAIVDLLRQSQDSGQTAIRAATGAGIGQAVDISA